MQDKSEAQSRQNQQTPEIAQHRSMSSSLSNLRDAGSSTAIPAA